MKKTITLILLAGICLISCAQDSSVQRVDSEEINYILTYLEKDNVGFYEAKNDYYLRTIKIHSNDYVTLNDDGEVRWKDEIYFTLATYDESPHLDSKTFKSIPLLNVKIMNVTFISNSATVLLRYDIYKNGKFEAKEITLKLQ